MTAARRCDRGRALQLESRAATVYGEAEDDTGRFAHEVMRENARVAQSSTPVDHIPIMASSVERHRRADLSILRDAELPAAAGVRRNNACLSAARYLCETAAPPHNVAVETPVDAANWTVDMYVPRHTCPAHRIGIENVTRPCT